MLLLYRPRVSTPVIVVNLKTQEIQFPFFRDWGWGRQDHGENAW